RRVAGSRLAHRRPAASRRVGSAPEGNPAFDSRLPSTPPWLQHAYPTKTGQLPSNITTESPPGLKSERVHTGKPQVHTAHKSARPFPTVHWPRRLAVWRGLRCRPSAFAREWPARNSQRLMVAMPEALVREGAESQCQGKNRE